VRARRPLALRDEALELGDVVATVRDVRIDAAAANVVPGRADVTVDVRAPESDRLAAIAAAVRRLASKAGAEIEQSDAADIASGVAVLTRTLRALCGSLA
jgi:acetylornithine deacetylase/succinyl-diaminopimelate desuccinylase-like protein